MLGTAFVSVDHSDFYLSFLSYIFQDEIPYSCEVVIDAFKDKTPQLSLIEACIVVRAYVRCVDQQYIQYTIVYTGQRKSCMFHIMS
jgi:hypothetical protein